MVHTSGVIVIAAGITPEEKKKLLVLSYVENRKRKDQKVSFFMRLRCLRQSA